MSVHRLIGGGLTLARGQTRPTATGECPGCHVVYQVDLRVQQPRCPDCGDPVLVRDGQPEPERTPDKAHGFNRPRSTQPAGGKR